MAAMETEARALVESTQGGHAYPSDLARFARERWEDHSQDGEWPGYEQAESPDALTLETLISTCFQAGLLREEERPVAFRAIFASPEEFPEEEGPPYGLHRMEFDEPRPFDEYELRRLSPAADLQRSLIGVCRGDDGGMKIWGIVSSGPRWLRAVQGGRELSAPLPPVPVIKVHEPGRLMVKKGSVFVAELVGGRITGSRSDVFSSRWIADRFVPIRDELLELHTEARLQAAAEGEPWAPLDPDLPRMVAQQMVKRLVSIVRDARHGATIIVVPPNKTREALSGERVSLKHTFAEGKPRRRFHTLIVRIMNRLAQIHGKGNEDYYPKAVGWEEYQRTDDRKLAELDEAIFEFAHLVAGLAAIDGAVVMTQHFELLGMGGEISGGLPDVTRVRKALDQEGDQLVEEYTDGVGTRHRSAYRLAAALPDTLTMVFSQDGDLHFVKDKDGVVTLWDQA